MLLEKVCESEGWAERETDGEKGQIFDGDDKVHGEESERGFFDVLFTERELEAPV